MAVAAPPPQVVPAQRIASQDDVRLACEDGGPSFRPSALRRPTGFERGKGELATALRAFLRESADDVDQPRTGWRLVGRTSHAATFLAGRRAPYDQLNFERSRGRWEWLNSGGCFPAATRGGLKAVSWAPVGRPAPGARRISVLVQEDNCASGGDARGRVRPALVRYDATSVRVAFFVRPLGGISTCQGVPPTPVTLVLAEPLGARTLLDLGRYPVGPPSLDGPER